MKSLISKLRSNSHFKAITYWSIVVLLFLYTFSIPSFSGRGGWYIVSYFLMALFAVFTIIHTFLYSKFKINKWLILPASFVIFTLIGTSIYSHDFRMWLTLVLMLITLLVFYYSFDAIDNYRFLCKILLFAFLAFGIYYIIIYRDPIFHFRISDSRLGAYFDNVNAIGFYFTIAFTLSLFIGLFYKRKLELLYLIPALIFLFLGFFTGSRAFLIGVLSSVVVVIFFKLRKRLLLFATVIGLLIGLCFILVNIPQLNFLKDQFERTVFTIFGIGQSKIDTSTVQRIIWPKYAYYLGSKNMLFGYGCNGFKIYSGVGTYAHNNFAELICDFGLIGFVLFTACYLIPVLLSFDKKGSGLILVPILFAIYFFRNFFGVTYYSKEAYLVIGLLFYLTKDCKLPKLFVKRKKTIVKSFCEVSI